ncbi:DNA integrity scanning protein DisA [Tsukamurella tyrosinosolvens]|uniref:DNA integrity scanning protein DisA n=1 Tax=Tsukamurella tyrosinosolvens TaxID=57704 RepID=A0A1H4ME20_TSUTY|nr:DNA integrity scanning diadenylate cyclase DisA [Tsukamurella tyrosinosolvens]AUN39122.1 DNA integrity scanning protein DisA [Tsukamurella tyrosinosolvens]KXO96838.1 DNA integrity scanning protein DisA [Tsukamurella tyrosinosolvens]KXP02380.1 DNA integrity scanning protein DisA [Tsukamurella tyrosinosolvens]KZL96518.1 DNA integrity scanning protein DisA [Tsukamurella tyrosinosolvens]MCA4996406.1 DNA integrity scanning protein DisA [Tsukamurella tyrosinosolvens]
MNLEAAFVGNAPLRDTVIRVAPGTPLRDGIERILRGRTGALIVLGYDDAVEGICDGGFHLDVEFAPTRLRELAKMDGAVVLSTDGSRIVRANVQLVPDPAIPTQESGTRHRSAERAAIQTGYPVISVSASMSIVHAYVGGVRHLVDDAAPILSRANLAIATLERYAHRLDEVLAQLSRAEIEDVVTVREVAHVVQRLELVRRLAVEIEQHVLELGTSGRQIALQLEDLLGESISLREPVLRDYLGDDDTVDAAVVRIDALTDADLLAATTIAAALGFSGTVEAQDEPVSPRGHRLLGSIPRLRATQVEALVGTFGSLQTLLAASAADLQAVPGIGSDGARQAREGLSRLAEASVERF